jgi:hypothetical protein
VLAFIIDMHSTLIYYFGSGNLLGGNLGVYKGVKGCICVRDVFIQVGVINKTSNSTLNTMEYIV